MASPTLKYTYFDLAARGEPCRLAMVIGGIPFEDDRVKFPDFPPMKPTLPLGSLPVISITDASSATTHQSSQTMAILRYLGKLAGSYPSDPIQALRVDEVLDTVLDFFNGLFKYNGTDKDELIKSRKEAVEKNGARYWGGIESIIEKNNPGKTYVISDDEVSIADIAIAGIYILFQLGFLDGLESDALDQYKRMKAIYEKIMKIPTVIKYYNQHPFKKN